MKRAAILVVLLSCCCVAALAQNYSKIPRRILEEQFLYACEMGDLETVKTLLDHGVSPNVRDRFNQPAIVRAVRSAHIIDNEKLVPVLKLLVEKGASVNDTNDFGSTPIFLTEVPNEFKGKAHLFLLVFGADQYTVDKYGLRFFERPNFYDYVKTEPEETGWRLLLEGDLDHIENPVKSRYKNSATFPMAAAYYGDIRSDGIISRGDGETDNRGETYLFYLAERRLMTISEMPGEIDPKIVDLRNKQGETALIRAAQFDSDYLITRILKAGANPDIRDNTGRTAVFLTLLHLLIKADPNIAVNGKTALMAAAEAGNLRAVAAFVNSKRSAAAAALEAKTNLKERTTLTALATALDRLNPDLRDSSGRTALMIAAEKGFKEIVEGLLQIKADTSLKDNTGKTALDLAKRNGHAEIIKLLAPQGKGATGRR
jgi:ankyrin repeat protein